MTAKLFDDQEDPVEITIPEDDPLKPFIEKYKDPLGVAKALVEKDRFISQLQRENGETRAELASRISVEEKVDRLLQGTPVVPNTPVVTNPAGQTNEITTNTSGLSLEDVEKLLAKKQEDTVREQNLINTRKELERIYGSDWSRIVQNKAKELGESVEFMTTLAQNKPNVLFKLLGEKPQAQPVATPFQGQNTTSQVFNAGSQQRTMSYYNKIKDKNPAEYWSPKVQNQMHKDSLQLREAFFDV